MIVTIIIPTYNRAQFLERAVASIMRQGAVAQFDILIVDDGSTDDTATICADLQKTHDNIRLVRRDNGGVAAARNTGLQNLLPETEIVTFLDSDDVFPADRFALDLVHFDDPSVDMTYGKLLQVTALDPQTFEPVPDSATLEARLVQLSSGLYRRALVDRTGRFAEDLEQAEDTDFLYRMFEEGAHWVSTDTITVYYVRHDGNMTNDRVTSQKCSARALMRSIKRRRDEPWRALNMPPLGMDVLEGRSGSGAIDAC